jgi:hypothetical protein
VRFGNEVRTLALDEMKRHFQAGEINTETFVCKVGDSAWRKIAEIASLDLGPPPELQSVTSVYERPVPFAPLETAPRTSAFRRIWQRTAGREHPLSLAMWIFLGVISLGLILQRSGALYATSSWIGLEKQYEALELDLLGGPGNGTTRSAEKLWLESIPEGSIPFSDAAKRDLAVDKKPKE